MLVLQRHPKNIVDGKDEILIGEDIRIVILRITGNNEVHIAIDAPGLNIVRGELVRQHGTT